MELGRSLLADAGIDAVRAFGFAAWRVGPADGDVISHTPHSQGYATEGHAALAYHAWLEYGGFVIDLTTYQLEVKARQLDLADGGHTTVDWSPDFLLLPPDQIQTYRQVATAERAGAAYYEVRPELLAVFDSSVVLDPGDLETTRLLLANPDVAVCGPNDMSDSALHRSSRMEAQKTMRTHAPDLQRYLKAREVTYVRVEYSGSNGGGGFDALQFARADGTACFIGTEGAFHLRLKAIFRALLHSRYPTWCQGDGSCGDFRWELTADLLTHSHYLRGSTGERSTHHNL
jgi:hypothetical protein